MSGRGSIQRVPHRRVFHSLRYVPVFAFIASDFGIIFDTVGARCTLLR